MNSVSKNVFNFINDYIYYNRIICSQSYNSSTNTRSLLSCPETKPEFTIKEWPNTPSWRELAQANCKVLNCFLAEQKRCLEECQLLRRWSFLLRLLSLYDSRPLIHFHIPNAPLRASIRSVTWTKHFQSIEATKSPITIDSPFPQSLCSSNPYEKSGKPDLRDERLWCPVLSGSVHQATAAHIFLYEQGQVAMENIFEMREELNSIQNGLILSTAAEGRIAKGHLVLIPNVADEFSDINMKEWQSQFRKISRLVFCNRTQRGWNHFVYGEKTSKRRGTTLILKQWTSNQIIDRAQDTCTGNSVYTPNILALLIHRRKRRMSIMSLGSPR